MPVTVTTSGGSNCCFIFDCRAEYAPEKVLSNICPVFLWEPRKVSPASVVVIFPGLSTYPNREAAACSVIPAQFKAQRGVRGAQRKMMYCKVDHLVYGSCVLTQSLILIHCRGWSRYNNLLVTSIAFVFLVYKIHIKRESGKSHTCRFWGRPTETVKVVKKGEIWSLGLVRPALFSWRPSQMVKPHLKNPYFHPSLSLWKNVGMPVLPGIVRKRWKAEEVVAPLQYSILAQKVLKGYQCLLWPL